MPATAEDPVDAARLGEREVAEYQREGFTVLRGLAAPATVAALLADVREIMRVARMADPRALCQSSEYLAGSALDRWIGSPGLRALASGLVGGPATPYLPFTAVKTPGGGKFSFHQDNQYTRHDGPSCNLWLALTAMGEREGALRMLPRSHLAGTLRSVEAPTDGHAHRAVDFAVERFTTLDLRPGDLVAFSRLTVHGSGPNASPEPRIGYAVQFHRDDVRAFFDDRWELLTHRPRFRVAPVERLSPPQGRIDGH